jgi:hypothetical protein
MWEVEKGEGKRETGKIREEKRTRVKFIANTTKECIYYRFLEENSQRILQGPLAAFKKFSQAGFPLQAEIFHIQVSMLRFLTPPPIHTLFHCTLLILHCTF